MPSLKLPCLLILMVAFAACGNGTDFDALVAADDTFAVLVSGGDVVDGTGARPRRADVLVRGDEIVYVGDVDRDRISVETIVDASGQVVAPGYIDPHSHGDPISTPHLRNFLAMGVTTITLGQDGSSPRTPDLSRWMQSVDSVGPAVNVAVFAGHGTLRHLSGIGNSTDPTPTQIDSMVSLLRLQLEAGAFGLSTGLEYTPGAYSGRDELLALARATGSTGRVVMSHLRNEDDDAVEGAIRELLDLADPARVHVSHIKSVYGKGAARAEEILAVLDSARATGVEVTADMYPYTASYTGISILFPLWARAPNDYAEVVRTRRTELATYLRDRVTLRNGPEATLIGTGRFAGLTLAEVADRLERPFEDVLIDDIGPGGASGAYFVMDEQLQERLAADPYVMFSSDGSLDGYHPRGHGTFAKIIEDYVQQKELMTLEEAVRKMTSFPAETIGISDRGKVAPGYKADILVFDPAAIRATATYAQPHTLATGLSRVFVNGRSVYSDGKFSDFRAGRMLRHGHSDR